MQRGDHMVKKLHPFKASSRFVSPARKTMSECRSLFKPFYVLFGGQVEDGFKVVCSSKNFRPKHCTVKEEDMLEFITTCEQIRCVLRDQLHARHRKIEVLENTLAKIKFMHLKYHFNK